MKKRLGLLIASTLLTFTLAACQGDAVLNNFDPRQDNTLFSSDEQIIIDYKTDNEGRMIEINIDRLLTIEQMILLNPIIDFDYDLPGFTGDIFTEPSARCTDFSNDLLIPINIEIGNTRYKYDNTDCTYKTVDNYNQFKPGFAREYMLTDTILEDKNTTISIIVYNPGELVTFVEIYQLPHTYELLGLYNIMFNYERDAFDSYPNNYYRDMSIYEQLYLKHQENEGAVNEVLGITTELNIMDLTSLTEIIPLIEDFEEIYEMEINAIEELQQEIGLNFTTEEEPDDDDQTPTE